MHFKPPYLLTEFVFKTSRSGGAGGQNVNKVATKVQIDFDIPHSVLLTQEEKDILLSKLEDKVSKEGKLQIVSQTERTQLGNKEIAINKLYNTLNKCFVVRKKRKPSKPTKSSIEKRLTSKKLISKTKQSRTKKNWD
jgi:ribosome-associated protein